VNLTPACYCHTCGRREPARWTEWGTWEVEEDKTWHGHPEGAYECDFCAHIEYEPIPSTYWETARMLWEDASVIVFNEDDGEDWPDWAEIRTLASLLSGSTVGAG